VYLSRPDVFDGLGRHAIALTEDIHTAIRTPRDIGPCVIDPDRQRRTQFAHPLFRKLHRRVPAHRPTRHHHHLPRRHLAASTKRIAVGARTDVPGKFVLRAKARHAILGVAKGGLPTARGILAELVH